MTEALVCAGLCKRFGGVVATDGLTLSLARGEIHALIGPNGAGKSTAIAQLAGELRPDAGRIMLNGEDITGCSVPARARRGLARSYQITSILPAFTARQNLALAAQVRSGHSFRFWRDATRDPRLTVPAMAMLERIGLGARANARAEDLAHGEQRQLELAMALACEPEVLLLDEPMAGLGPAESRAMVALIAGLRGRVSILLVEHDMDAVFALADRLTVLVAGRAIATGAPEAIRADAGVREAYLGEE